MEPKIFCKFCKSECIKRVSRTELNPGREYFSCPVDRASGGHGWMHWVDCSSPNSKKRYDILELSEHNREQLALCEAKLRSVEAKRLKDRDTIALLKAGLEEDKKHIRCLKKVVKGLVVLCIVLLFFILF